MSAKVSLFRLPVFSKKVFEETTPSAPPLNAYVGWITFYLGFQELISSRVLQFG